MLRPSHLVAFVNSIIVNIPQQTRSVLTAFKQYPITGPERDIAAHTDFTLLFDASKVYL